MGLDDRLDILLPRSEVAKVNDQYDLREFGDAIWRARCEMKCVSDTLKAMYGAESLGVSRLVRETGRLSLSLSLSYVSGN